MNKKMKELLAQIDGKVASAQALMEAGETEKAAACMDEADKLQRDYDTEERIYNAQKRQVPAKPQPAHGGEEEDDGEGKEKSVSGFALIAKCLRGQPFTEDELEAITPEPEVAKALLTGTNAANGESYLIPEDVDNKINELRRRFVSAKELVTEMPTTVLSGSFTWENGAPVGLVAFDDGNDIPASDEPKFKNVKFAISFKGAIIPISNILTAVEAAGLTAYLNRWFVKKAVISENADIFAELKNGKEAKALTGMDDLQESLNLDLDPDCLIGGVIATNQTGFNLMDKEKDANGRKLLQPDPAKPTGKLFKGLPVKVYSDAQLPNVDGKAPVFYGDTKAGVWFIGFQYTFFASSAHAGFKKNQTLLRVIEGYDVIAADKEAYCYGLLAPAVAAASLSEGGTTAGE